MTVEETLAKLRSHLTGNTDDDMKYLEAEAVNFMNGKDKERLEIIDGITKIMYEIMPEEKKKVINDMMYVDGSRLDVLYNKAEELVKNKEIEAAYEITTKIYNKILAVYRETEESKYMCFRNPFEHQLYLNIYVVNKKLERAPFDLPKMMLLHAYILVEMRKPAEAAEVLNQAIRYNPVNVDVYFELAECYKVLCEPDKLLSSIKEALLIASTPYALSRCYANLGYYCIEKKDYDSAVCFYYESLIYAPHPGVQGELMHIASITRKKIQPPIREEVVAAFNKYGLTPGADKDLLAIAAALGQEAIKREDNNLARFYLIILYGLTRDEKVGDLIEKKYGGIPEELKSKSEK